MRSGYRCHVCGVRFIEDPHTFHAEGCPARLDADAECPGTNGYCGEDVCSLCCPTCGNDEGVVGALARLTHAATLHAEGDAVVGVNVDDLTLVLALARASVVQAPTDWPSFATWWIDQQQAMAEIARRLDT